MKTKTISIFLLIVLSLLVCFQTFAEGSKIDSLLNKLKTAKQDTNKVNLLQKLCWEIRRNDPEKSVYYGKQGLALAEKIKYKNGLIICFNALGEVNRIQGNYNEAIDYHKKSLKISKELGNKIKIAASYGNLGIIYKDLGNYDIALKYQLRSLKIEEELENKIGVAETNTNIGVIYYYQENYEKTLEYFIKVLKVDKEIGDKQKIADDLNNLGVIYFSLEKYNKALEYHLQSKELKEKLDDKHGLSTSLNNIGNVYYALKKYNKSIKYFKKSLKLYQELGTKRGITECLNNIASVYKKCGNYDKTIEYHEKSLKIAKEIGAKYDIKQSYQNLSEVYALKKDFNNAYKYFQLYSNIKDTLFNEEKNKQITEMQIIYETEKKEKELIKKDAELNKQQAETKRQKIVSWSVGSGLFLVLVFSVLLYNRFRVTRRQKKVIEEQNKDIKDSIHYAEQIQRAILPKDEEVERLLPENFVLFKPKDIVSGDFYWLGEEGGKVFFAACDCTGHGVPGALMSMMINALLSEAVNEKGITKPSLIFYEVRNGIIKSLKQTGAEGEQKDGMDAVLCMWDKANNTMEFAAAFNSLYLIRKEELLETKGDKQPIGFYLGEQIPFTNHEIKLQKEDIIYIFSDGYADQFGGPNGKKFKSKQFKQLLVDVHKKEMAEQKAILDKTFEDWKGDLEQIDDILVMGIRI